MIETQIVRGRRIAVCILATLGCVVRWALVAGSGVAQSTPKSGSPLAERIEQIIGRPEFRHAIFGIEFYDLDTGTPVYALDADKLFKPASTTKLLTEGTALELLGPDYRFHTRVYRTGAVAPDGALKGDLVLIASGDPNLSGRIQPSGTLAFQNEDHSYGGPVVPGDPLAVIRELARQVAAHGIRRIEGLVRVDISLFPEGEAEGGTGMIQSPIVVNDNVIDVMARPGAAVGAALDVKILPATAYLRLINHATTRPPSSKPELKWEKDFTNADGSHVAVLAGTLPLGGAPEPQPALPYAVPQPSRFAETVFAEALREAAVDVPFRPAGREDAGLKPGATGVYTPENVVAEHVSPPLSEEVKLTLKVSQNLHASITPYILGAVLGHAAAKDALQAGFDLERGLLQKAGLDLTGASQGDGAGGAGSDFFTPDFMVHYLAYMAKQKDFPVFFSALPILGRDGTLWNIQVDSPAAGHVHAKTGTYDEYDALNHKGMVSAKGLAGYFTTPDGRHFAFAVYANRVAVPTEGDAATRIVGQALGEIAAAGYSTLSGLARASSGKDFGVPPKKVYDVLIKSGRIIDGTGNPWFAGDVALRLKHPARVAPWISSSIEAADRIQACPWLAVRCCPKTTRDTSGLPGQASQQNLSRGDEA